MAAMVQLTILGTPKVTFSTSQIWVLPVTSFLAAPQTTAASGQHSLITVFPTGLNQPAKLLYCAETVAEIATAANA
jgi:hypothetical protein